MADKIETIAELITAAIAHQIEHDRESEEKNSQASFSEFLVGSKENTK